MDSGEYDVIIVGGGPGGLSCARHLSGSGLRVLVLEKNDGPGKKICSGEISSKVYPDEDFDRGHPWTEIHVGTEKKKHVLKFNRPYLWTIGRREIEGHIASKCEADIRFGEPATKITDTHVETDRGRYSYGHLVGADGSFSLVRKHLGLPANDISGWAYHVVLDNPCPEFHMHWLPETLPSGYGYMMSRSREKTMVGLAWRGEDFDHGRAARAKKWIGERFGIDAAALRSEAMKGNADCRGWKFGNIYLVGDAGGFLNPLTTEGIFYAIKSGEGVARHILGDAEGRRIMERMVDAHRWQVRIYKMANDPRNPLHWIINWVLDDPNSGIRRKIFDWVFWKFMDG